MLLRIPSRSSCPASHPLRPGHSAISCSPMSLVPFSCCIWEDVASIQGTSAVPEAYHLPSKNVRIAPGAGGLYVSLRCMHAIAAAQVQFLETRSAGQSIATLINLLFSFVIGQARACSLPRVPSARAGSWEGMLQEQPPP